jgi:O-antigen/teichoic acid export membrane protein
MLGGLVALFGSPINFVLLPTISKAWEQNRKQDVKNYFEYSIKLFLTLAIPAAAGLCILSQPLLKLLTTSEYMVGSGLVLLVAVGAIFSGIYGINVFIVYLLKQTKWLPLMIVAVSVTNVGLNLVLTPSIGIIGSAISNIISYFMLSLIVFVWARKRFKYDVDFRYLGKVIAATLGMALCLHYLKVGGVSGIILSTIVGITVFCIILLLLRAFSDQDKRLIKQLFVR